MKSRGLMLHQHGGVRGHRFLTNMTGEPKARYLISPGSVVKKQKERERGEKERGERKSFGGLAHLLHGNVQNEGW